jgi:hypothetical protein
LTAARASVAPAIPGVPHGSTTRRCRQRRPSDAAVGTFTDWLNYEFAVGDLRWLTLDPKRVVTTGTWVQNPDLSKVDEIGFADLMPGSGHGAGGWMDVAQVEVYANSTAR